MLSPFTFAAFLAIRDVRDGGRRRADGRALRDVARTLPWFVERLLARSLGPIVGLRIADAGRNSARPSEYAARRIAASTLDLRARRSAGARASADMRALVDDTELLAARIDGVARARPGARRTKLPPNHARTSGATRAALTLRPRAPRKRTAGRRWTPRSSVSHRRPSRLPSSAGRAFTTRARHASCSWRAPRCRACRIPSCASPGHPGAGKSTLIASYLDARKAHATGFQADAGRCRSGTFFQLPDARGISEMLARPG